MTGYTDDTDVWEYEPAPPSPEDVAAARENALAAAEEAERAVVTAVATAGRKPRKAVRDVATEAGREAGAKVARRFGVLALIAALVVPWLVSGLAYSQSVETGQMVEAMTERLDALNVAVEARGQAPILPADTEDPTAVIAAVVLAEVITRLPPAPSAEEVAAELRDVVSANVLGPTLDQASVLVADYLRDNPAPAGPPPSQQDIDAAVARQYAADPPADGEDGADGQDGAPGAPGADGRSILTGPEPVRLDDGSCVWRSTYSAEPTVQQYPAGDSACPDPAPDDGGDNGGGGLIAPGTSVMAPFLSLIGWSSP